MHSKSCFSVGLSFLNGDHQYYKMEKWWNSGLEQSIIPNVTMMYMTQVISYFMWLLSTHFLAMPKNPHCSSLYNCIKGLCIQLLSIFSTSNAPYVLIRSHPKLRCDSFSFLIWQTIDWFLHFTFSWNIINHPSLIL